MDTSSPTPGTQKFKVRFGDGARYRTAMPNSFKLHGKGFIQFEANTVKFGGKRHRPFWFGVPEEHCVARASILDARVSGKYVVFDVEQNEETNRRVGFAAANRQTAATVMSLLPQRRSEGFAQEQALLADFQDRLQKLGRRSIVVPILVALNVLIFVLMVMNGANVLLPSPTVAIQWGSNFSPLTVGGQWWRLLTATFVHFGVLHLVLNMFALYQTGREVERLFGSLRFLGLYVFSGLTGSLFSLFWYPLVNAAGASGAIFGVFGGLLVLTLDPRNGVPRSLMMAHRSSTIAFIAYSLLNGFSHAGIDNAAHIGGLLGGIAMGLLLARPIGLPAPVRVSKAQATAGGIIALLVGVGGYGLFHPSRGALQEAQFQRQLDTLTAREEKVLGDTKHLLEVDPASAAEKIALANAVEKQVLPQWEVLYHEMNDSLLDEQSPRHQLQQYILRYLDDRRKSSRLFVDALRQNDAQLMTQSNAFTKDAFAQIELIKHMPAK